MDNVGRIQPESSNERPLGLDLQRIEAVAERDLAGTALGLIVLELRDKRVGGNAKHSSHSSYNQYSTYSMLTIGC